MNENKQEMLIDQARGCRTNVLKMTNHVGAGHVGGSLSEIEILTSLYFSVMDIDPKNPNKPDRDRFILSKGHSSAGYYSVLAARGYFDESVLYTFDQMGSPLQAHPDMHKCKGVDYSTGSLGQGLSIGIGMVTAGAMKGFNFKAFVLIGDGEAQEGQIWEALMYAGSQKTKNIIAIFDYNRVQLSSTMDENVDIGPLADKLKAFNFEVIEAMGNDICDIEPVLQKAKTMSEQGPVAVIAHTKKGAGVSFMEGKCAWHGKAPNNEELRMALEEVDGGKNNGI